MSEPMVVSRAHGDAGQTGSVPFGAESLPPLSCARKKQFGDVTGLPLVKVLPGLTPLSVSFLGSAYRPARTSAAVGLSGRFCAAASKSLPPDQPWVEFGSSFVLLSYLAIAARNSVAAGVSENQRKLFVGM